MDDFKRAKTLLGQGHTLALVKGDEQYLSDRRGVRPLLDLFDTGADLRGFYAADKVVGLGAAHLYRLIGVRALYAEVISESAEALLISSAIRVERGQCVPRILNRDKSGFCPIEQAVMGIKDSRAALLAIRRRLSELEGG